MQLFSSSVLCNDKAMMQALALGDVHTATPTLSRFEAVIKPYHIFDFPFLFNGIEAGKQILI